ncbi:MAG: hypothetical protein GXO43_06155 [Crenarchaeota archaeon]|nr:hypothetical protein [Thermoproteota archaeon]
MNNVKYLYHFHSLIVSIFTYEPNIVIKILRTMYPRWRVFSKNVRFIRPEFSTGFRYADVIWVMKDEDQYNWYLLAFEIKTGKYRSEWMRQIKDIRIGLYEASKRLRKRGIIRGKLALVHRYIFLVGWKREIEKVKERIKGSELDHGKLRVIPLEYFRDICIRRAREIVDLFTKLY